jgi:Fe-S cluster assembly protein SufD
MISLSEPVLSSAAVEALSELHNEPDWLREQRSEALRLFEALRMPDANDEEWKRLDATRLTLDGIAPGSDEHAPAAGPSELRGDLRSLWDENEPVAARIIQLDGTAVHRWVDESVAQKGVIVTDLHSAAREHKDIVRQHIGSLVRTDEWKYLALHGALWSGGCLVYVPAGVDVELPVEYAVGLSASSLVVFPKLLVIAEADSSVTVILEQASPPLEALSVVSGAVEAFVGRDARVRFVEAQRWGRGVQHFGTARARVEKGGSFQSISLGIGATLTKARLDVSLPDEGGRAELLGLFIGDEDQHFDYDTRQDHEGAKTESDLLFKAALDGTSSFAWTGVVDIGETASASAANQTSRNLLLSDKASASPTPVLEISAHDVARCSHGATVGPVDPEQIFYLQSRGIPAEEVERMLVEGFYSEVLERVPSDQLKERVRRLLKHKLRIGD